MKKVWILCFLLFFLTAFPVSNSAAIPSGDIKIFITKIVPYLQKEFKDASKDFSLESGGKTIQQLTTITLVRTGEKARIKYKDAKDRVKVYAPAKLFLIHLEFKIISEGNSIKIVTLKAQDILILVAGGKVIDINATDTYLVGRSWIEPEI